MLKVSWGTSMKALQSHFAYIAGTGKYKNKHKNERVITSKNIANREAQDDFLDRWAAVLAPDRAKKQRRSKRTDLRIILSWKGKTNHQKQSEFLKRFMTDNFPDSLWTYAKHEKLNKFGKFVSHYHVCVCSRALSGSMHGISRSDLQKLKVSFQSLSKQVGLATGWEMAAPNKPNKSRSRRARGKGGRKSAHVDRSSSSINLKP